MYKFSMHQWENKSCSDDYMKYFSLNSGECTVVVAASNFVIALLNYWCGACSMHWDLFLSSLTFTLNVHNVPKKKSNGSGCSFKWTKPWGNNRGAGLSLEIYENTREVNIKSLNTHFKYWNYIISKLPQEILNI